MRSDCLAGNDVETDGWLIKEGEPRCVQQRGGKLAAHPFAKRERAHRSIKEVAKGESLRQVGDTPANDARLQIVDVAQQLKG